MTFSAVSSCKGQEVALWDVYKISIAYVGMPNAGNRLEANERVTITHVILFDCLHSETDIARGS
jgi:hypothetical protein